MTLIEQATEDARHCSCGHEGDCHHFKLIAALEAAQAMADAVKGVEGVPGLRTTLARFQEAMNHDQ